MFRGISEGAPPLTTIQDTLYKADGSTFEGTLAINWKSFEAPDASSIPTNNLSIRVVKGIVNLKLVPTTTAPSPAYYSVRYVTDGAVQYTEYWSVPPSASRLRVRDIRVTWPPESGAVGGGQVGNIQLPDVEGLAEELSIRPTKGLSYLASRAAVIGSTGELESAAGDPNDCVRVDGSAGPCGAPLPSFVDGETPSGVIDGVNLSFTLSGTPEPVASLQVFRNGLLQKRGTDYTISGSSLVFVPASVPQAGDLLLAYYRQAPALIGAIGIKSRNGSFALASVPKPANSLLGLKLDRLPLSAPVPDWGAEERASHRIQGN